MVPAFLVKDSANMSDTDAKKSSDSSRNHSFLTKLPNFNDLSICQFGRANSCALGLTISCHHILGIICMIAEVQVIRIYTRRAIATVKNPQTVSVWTISQFPSHSMGCMIFILVAERSISAFISKSLPKPTLARSVNSAPEPLSSANRNAFSSIAMNAVSAAPIPQALFCVFPFVTLLAKFTKVALSRIKFFYHDVVTTLTGCHSQDVRSVAGSFCIL